MSRVLVDSEAYELVHSSAMYEADFEQLVISYSQQVFPWATAVQFKRKLHTPFGNAVPDFILLDKRYRKWWIVEVELSSHDLFGHVVPQIEIFSHSRFTHSDAEFLCQNCPDLDIRELAPLMLESDPGLHVVVDKASAEWTNVLRQFGATVGVFEVFRSQTNKHVVRVNGQNPSLSESFVCRCKVGTTLTRTLAVESRGALLRSIGERDEVAIEYDGALSAWSVVPLENVLLLVPKKRYPLHPRFRSFDLVLMNDEVLTLRPSR